MKDQNGRTQLAEAAEARHLLDLLWDRRGGEMRTYIAGLALALVGFSLSLPAHAAGEADTSAPGSALGECITLKTTGADRLLTARWMIGSLGSAPQLKDMVSVNPVLKTEADKGIAALLTRLLAVDCVEHSRPLIKARNNAALEIAGEALGEMALKELLTNDEASAAMSSFEKFLREEDFAILRE